MLRKLNQKGAMFVEYALILAFVIVVGVVFLGNNSMTDNTSKVIEKTASTLSTAASKAGA